MQDLITALLSTVTCLHDSQQMVMAEKNIFTMLYAELLSEHKKNPLVFMEQDMTKTPLLPINRWGLAPEIYTSIQWWVKVEVSRLRQFFEEKIINLTGCSELLIFHKINLRWTNHDRFFSPFPTPSQGTYVTCLNYQNWQTSQLFATMSSGQQNALHISNTWSRTSSYFNYMINKVLDVKIRELLSDITSARNRLARDLLILILGYDRSLPRLKVFNLQHRISKWNQIQTAKQKGVAQIVPQDELNIPRCRCTSQRLLKVPVSLSWNESIRIQSPHTTSNISITKSNLCRHLRAT